MSWTSAITELRVLLSDGPTDKLQAFKQVFGIQNGSCTAFKTFEFRRITDFSSTGLAFPLGLYLNGERVDAACVASDDLATGYFILVTGVSDSQQLTATYYSQWFNDDELDDFLVHAAKWLGGSDDYSLVAGGLQDAALKFAASEAYQKLSLTYARAIVETYRLEDSPDEKRMQIVEAYDKAAKDYAKAAKASRDDYYERKGQSLAPRFGVVTGNVQNPTRS